MAKPTANYYRVLQVDPAADPEVIEAAYRRLARKYHPDTNKEPDALRRMQEINEAYEVLGSADRRARYDAARAREERSREVYVPRPTYRPSQPSPQPAPEPAAAPDPKPEPAATPVEEPRAEPVAEPGPVADSVPHTAVEVEPAASVKEVEAEVERRVRATAARHAARAREREAAKLAREAWERGVGPTFLGYKRETLLSLPGMILLVLLTVPWLLFLIPTERNPLFFLPASSLLIFLVSYVVAVAVAFILLDHRDSRS